MQFTLLARVLWAAGFIEQAALLLVLIGRRRYRSFPVFTAWIGFLVAKTAVLFTLYRVGSPREYAMVYWSGEVLDLLFQIGVIFEICRSVLRPTGTWIRDALRSFLFLAGIGLAVALVLSWFASPNSPNSLGAWIERGNIFSALLCLEVFLAMVAASTRLGLVWRNHVMGVASGWAVWAVVGFFVEAAFSYLGPNWHGIVLDQIRIVTYQLVTIYWIAMFWQNEPAERSISSQMQSYLLELHERIDREVKSLSSIRKQ